MSENKLKEVKEKVVGKAKETTGKVLDDKELELKGKVQQAQGKAREVADDIKDKATETKDEVKADVLGTINKKIDETEEAYEKRKREHELKVEKDKK